jgi:hypothetical protein
MNEPECPECGCELEHEDTFGNLDHALVAIGYKYGGNPQKAGDIYRCPGCDECYYVLDGDGQFRSGYPC